MNKERLKSITLVCLVILNFVLGSLIMTDKKLWPSGYNFFISLENTAPVRFFSSLKRQFAGAPVAATHLATPESIIINTGYQTSRFSVSPNDHLFDELTEACNKILSAAFSSTDNIAPTDENDWYSALMAKSIYLQYPADCESTLFAQFLGVKNTGVAGSVHTFSKLVVSTEDQATVYVQDSQNGAYYRISTRYASEALSKLIAKYQTGTNTSTSSSILNYSFDLRFHQPTSGQKAIIDPMIPIYSNPRTATPLQVKNPLQTSDGTLDSAMTEQILAVFGMNPNTVRHYPEAGGTMVFVENDAILKLHTNGLVDYRAKGQGIQLSRDNSAYDIHKEIAAMVDSVTNVISTDQNLYVSSPLYEDNATITFDYLAEGLPVVLDTEDMTHAVEAEIENGYLLSYRQLLRRYVPMGETVQTPAYITALDNAIDTYSASMNEITIEKIYLCYTDDGVNTVKNADWNVTVKSLIISEE